MTARTIQTGRCHGVAKQTSQCFVLLIMAFSVLGKGSDSSAASPAPMEAVVTGNTAFALDLYQREKRNSGNLFFSPYSISTALAMSYAGARGSTEQEMARALHFSAPAAEVSGAFGRLTERFEQIKEEKVVSLSVANSLWYERDYHFLDSFLKLNREDFRAEIRPMNFRSAPEDTRKAINSWVEQQTQDKIRDLLHPGQVTSSTRLVLCNAIYFKGKWTKQFNPKETRPAPFFLAPGKSVTVSMMSHKFELRSHPVEGATLFELPYQGNDLSLVVVLPEAVDGLAAVEQKLNAAILQSWLAALGESPRVETTLFLPKFKLDCRLDLAGDLAAMGMPSAFGRGADFSGMTGTRNLFIDGVVHQAFVDVNEEGTEAAAATGVTMRILSVRLTSILRVDHPFLFLIVEKQTGSILFLGRVTDPSG